MSRPSGRRALSLLVAPLRLGACALTPELPAAVVFVTDPEQELQPMETVLRGLFALTPTEGRVTNLLLRGTRVEEIAEQLRITQNTARTHLKRIFGKTGRGRRATSSAYCSPDSHRYSGTAIRSRRRGVTIWGMPATARAD